MKHKHEMMNLINQARSKARFDSILRICKLSKKSMKNLSIIIGVAAVIFFSFSLYSKSAQTKYSTIFHQALIEEEKGDVAASMSNLEQIYNAKFAPSGVKALASLRFGGSLLNNGNSAEALKVYTTIAQTRRYDDYIRDLAALLASKIIAIDVTAESEKTKLASDLALIEKFETKSKILRSYISEQKGIFLMKSGDLEKAYQTLSQFAQDKDASPTLKVRAADLVRVISSQGYEIKMGEDEAALAEKE